MTNEPRKPVLGDHTQVKRKLIPPAVRALNGKLAQYSWTRQLVPEAVWLALVIDRFGYDAARTLCRALVLAARVAVSRDDAPLFARTSAFSTLDEDARVRVRAALDAATLTDLATALRPLGTIVADHPLAFLDDDGEVKRAFADRLPAILQDLYDRHERLAVLSLAMAYDLAIAQGKMRVAPHLVAGLEADFAVIGGFPETEDAREASGRFRAAAPMLFMTPTEEGEGFREDDGWVGRFWAGVAGFGPCLFPDTFEDEAVEDAGTFESSIGGFRNAVRADVRARLGAWRLDLNQVETYEVIAALLSRQATLVLEFAAAPSMWTPHSAPITLRALADVFITLAWILKEPGPRARAFVEDGLGAIKLQIAHQERALENTTDPDDAKELALMIEIWRDWLSTQRMEQFVEVNLGSWSGLNTRQMANEAGFIDFYNYVYQPFSGVAHSNWSHVSMFNTAFCQNPAHRGHRSPAIMPTEPEAHWLYLAAKYLSKTLAHFDEVQELKGLPHSALDHFVRPSASEASGEASSAPVDE